MADVHLFCSFLWTNGKYLFCHTQNRCPRGDMMDILQFYYMHCLIRLMDCGLLWKSIFELQLLHDELSIVKLSNFFHIVCVLKFSVKNYCKSFVRIIKGNKLVIVYFYRNTNQLRNTNISYTYFKDAETDYS